MPKNKSTDSLTKQAQEPQDISEFSFIVEGRPRPKGRPRMSKRGRVYTPKETVEAEKRYIDAVGDNPPVFDGPVYVEMLFGKESTQIHIKSVPDWKTSLRGDIDNYVKLALDGVQRAGVIVNDRQVVGLEVSKL